MFSRFFSHFFLLCKSLQLMLFFLSKNSYLSSTFNCFHPLEIIDIQVKVKHLVVMVILNGIHIANKLTKYRTTSQTEVEETLRDWVGPDKVKQEGKEAPFLPFSMQRRHSTSPWRLLSYHCPLVNYILSNFVSHLMSRKIPKLSFHLFSLLLYINISVSLV